MKISFFIPGEPVAQGRPRATTINGRPRMYDAPKSATYKNMVSMVASRKMEKSILMEGAVGVTIIVHKTIPKSWSKKKQAQAIEGDIYPIGRPDIDNYVKAVFDGLNGIVFRDDSQVTHIIASKIYASTPGVSVSISETEVKN